MELEKLILKYEKLKKELDYVHNSEKRAVEKDIPVVLNDGKVLPSGGDEDRVPKTVAEKKRMLMRKIDNLDRSRKY
jgi:hypothetical protein